MDDINRFLLEDLNQKGDVTSDALFTNEQVTGNILAKEFCVLAGLEEAKMVFSRLGAKLNENVSDGEHVQPQTIIATVFGSARSILKAERLALNFLGRMSGIATVTNSLVERCKAINPHVTIAATRKTTPGFRSYEKKAVKIGGGEPHRYGLYDAILIKDNHLKIVGSISEALQRVAKVNNHVTIEVEVENQRDALIALSHNVHAIMLIIFHQNRQEKQHNKFGGITLISSLKYREESHPITF
jgi:nicotinate-nucleotide pyrophosphorylase (carboxylating)